MNRFFTFFLFFLFGLGFSGWSQAPSFDSTFLLKADRVFDGQEMHQGWAVLVRRKFILSVGRLDTMKVPAGAVVLNYKESTLLPGLIEGHSHLFLHPYNETPWNTQVLEESRAERVARATVHARRTLLAGFTTVRDLGTEGSLYDDVGLKDAIEKGIIPGPRMLCATRAIVATGTYGPRKLSRDQESIRGAAEADGFSLATEVRTQIGKGADLIKVYADYSWGPKAHLIQPTFTESEIRLAVDVANSSGRQVVAHAMTVEGMRRAIAAGVSTIEHGDYGTLEIFQSMKQKGIAYCPTIAAVLAYEQYAGYRKGKDPETDEILAKRNSFKAALESGVTICMGGDVGVYAHGDNAREMEAMVDFGMNPMDVLRSATSINARVFGLEQRVGKLAPGLLADLIVVGGDPGKNISDVRNVQLVMKDGVFYRR